MHRVYRQYVCLFCVWKHSFLGLLGNSNVNIVPFHSIVHFTTHKRWKMELELRAKYRSHVSVYAADIRPV